MNSSSVSLKIDWHKLPADQVLIDLATARGGLSDAEVARRLAMYGPNQLPPPRRHGPVVRFLLQFHNILIYVLLAAAAVTALLGHAVDTGVILGVVLINAIVGFVQEGKAESALAAIRKMLSLRALVLRNGERQEILAEQLVPGDWVILQSGDKVPADLRLVETKNLRIQEAVLTGEAEAVEKNSAPVAPDAAMGDRTCMAYSSTLVTYGQGLGVVVATGAAITAGALGAAAALASASLSCFSSVPTRSCSARNSLSTASLLLALGVAGLVWALDSAGKAAIKASASRLITVTIESNLPVMIDEGMYSWNRSWCTPSRSIRNGNATCALAK